MVADFCLYEAAICGKEYLVNGAGVFLPNVAVETPLNKLPLLDFTTLDNLTSYSTTY